MIECDPRGGAAHGAFAASPDGARWTYSGSLTFDNAASVVEAAQSLPLPASGHIDLSGIEMADSCALAVLLSLKRRAHSERRKLVFEAMPPDLEALARVYGIEGLV
jgi:phospholipid transport system transporter-binding protein